MSDTIWRDLFGSIGLIGLVALLGVLAVGLALFQRFLRHRNDAASVATDANLTPAVLDAHITSLQREIGQVRDDSSEARGQLRDDFQREIARLREDFTANLAETNRRLETLAQDLQTVARRSGR